MKYLNGQFVSDDIEKALRIAVESSGVSINQLAKALDLEYVCLQRLLEGKGVQTKTVKKIMKHFGMVVIRTDNK